MEVIEELSAVDRTRLIVSCFKLLINALALFLHLLLALREWIAIVVDGPLSVDLKSFTLCILVVTLEVK